MTISSRVNRFPVLFCLSIAATVLGFLLLIEPTLGDRSAALAIMPLWGLLLWAFAFLFGGAATVYGLLELRNDYESAGCTLQGFAYLTAAIATIFSPTIPSSPLGIMFLTALAAGLIWRAFAIR